jgi:HAD superfamily hydrolase (TIGR01509 family)
MLYDGGGDFAGGVMSELKGVIFDVDGTLVDSNDAHANAWVDAIKETGRPITYEIVRTLIGMGSDNLLPRVSDVEAHSAEAEAIAKRRGEIFKAQYLKTVQPVPGARALVQRLHDDGYHLAVASSAQRDEVDPLLEIAAVRELFEQQTSSSDAKQSKPDPDILVAALKRLQLEPAAVVMVGDTPYDVEAAQKAGVRVVGVRSGGWNDDALVGALAVYQDVEDLLRHYDQSVFKKRRI